MVEVHHLKEEGMLDSGESERMSKAIGAQVASLLADCFALLRLMPHAITASHVSHTLLSPVWCADEAPAFHAAAHHPT